MSEALNLIEDAESKATLDWEISAHSAFLNAKNGNMSRGKVKFKKALDLAHKIEQEYERIKALDKINSFIKESISSKDI